MLKIRLTRTGKKNRPHFRIVVAEHSRPVKGKFIEILGHYDPIKKIVVIKKDEIMKWLKNGAKPSNTVARLLQKEGLKHKAIIVQKFHKKPKMKGKKTEGKTESVVLKPQENIASEKPIDTEKQEQSGSKKDTATEKKTKEQKEDKITEESKSKDKTETKTTEKKENDKAKKVDKK